LGEQLELTTWGSALGSRWAERRTSITGSRGGRIETAALWIHVDVETGRPLRHSDAFLAAYEEAVAGRTISSRLVHPDPPSGTALDRGPAWHVRRSDLDVLGHVNNAVYWAVVEESFDIEAKSQLPFRAELEYRGGLDGDSTATVLVLGESLWITSGITSGDDVVATALVGYLDPSTRPRP
jgi:acyl-ACP thioesterase